MDIVTNSVVIFIDDQRIELTGQEAIDYEAQRAKDHQLFLDNQKKIEEAKPAKEALLAKLGITADEARLLLS